MDSSALPARALAIGSSDPAAEGGIQADIRAMAEAGAFPMAVVTSLIARAPGASHSVVPISRQLIGDQLEYLSETRMESVKVGDLHHPDDVLVVAAALSGHPGVRVVVDPAIFPADGSSPDPQLLRAYRELLLSLATVLTVDEAEAEALTGQPLGPGDAVRTLLSLGPLWIVIKGVQEDGAGEYEDLVSDGSQWFTLRSALVPAVTRGAGSLFAAAMAGRMAVGETPPQAAGWARDYVVRQLRMAAEAGPNGGPETP
jgi:hydroxymethylpyrimidine/phosphomethylpyrimidine kinase